MFVLYLSTLLCLSAVWASPLGDNDCVQGQNCELPNCLCYGTVVSDKHVPQFVYVTLDGSIQTLFADKVTNALQKFKNPQGDQKCNTATFFVSHEYTDYSKVNDLYCKGHEIGLRSVTSQGSPSYWENISTDDLKNEYSTEREFIEDYAWIKKENVKGMRLPFLQLSGDNSFDMMDQTDITYDASWSSLENVAFPLWPYTLDFQSEQDCQIEPCPIQPHKGKWVVPINDFENKDKLKCNNVDQCTTGFEEQEVLDFLKDNFNRHMTTSKAPFGLPLTYAWLSSPSNYNALAKFFDHLNTLNKDISRDDEKIFLTSIEKILEWIQNENGRASWSSCNSRQDCSKKCIPKPCRTTTKSHEKRVFVSCAQTCPKTYPWL